MGSSVLHAECHSDEQIDAIAVRQVTSTASTGSFQQAEDGSETVASDEEIDADDVASRYDELTQLAMAFSALEGNQWHGGIRLLDGCGMERLCEFRTASGISTVSWCGPDQSLLLGGCDNGELQLLRVVIDDGFAFIPQALSSASSEDVQGLIGHDDVVTGTSASMLNPTQVATCGWDRSVKLWDLTAMDKPVAAFQGHRDLVWAVAMHPTAENVIASGAQDCSMMLWDHRELSDRPASYVSTSFPVLSLDWHPQREHLVAMGLEDGSVLTYDMRSRGSPVEHLQELHTGAVHTVKYSPYAGDLLASGGDDTRICFTGEDAAMLPSDHPVQWHTDYVRGLDWMQVARPESGASKSSLDAMLVSGSWDKSLRVWAL